MTGRAVSVTRTLGTTEMRLSPVGLGTWAIGGGDWCYGWGPQDDADSIATVRRAVDAGVNWIDTAAVYGLGHAEEIIGAALAGFPDTDRPFVFTKCGLVWDEANRTAPPTRRMSRDSVRREVEDSLRRLRTERIDLYQVHEPDDGNIDSWGDRPRNRSPRATALEEYWQTMAELKSEGKVRAIGLSNHGVEELTRAERIAHVDTIQPTFSVIARETAPEIAWAQAHGTGVIVYQPMYSGLLAGSFSAERVAALPAGDWRRTHPEFTERLASNLAVVEELRAIATERGVPVPAISVAWTLAWPGVTGSIVGARRPGQIEDWADAATVTLSASELDRISTAITAAGVGSGPARPPSGAS